MIRPFFIYDHSDVTVCNNYGNTGPENKLYGSSTFIRRIEVDVVNEKLKAKLSEKITVFIHGNFVMHEVVGAYLANFKFNLELFKNAATINDFPKFNICSFCENINMKIFQMGFSFSDIFNKMFIFVEEDEYCKIYKLTPNGITMIDPTEDYCDMGQTQLGDRYDLEHSFDNHEDLNQFVLSKLKEIKSDQPDLIVEEKNQKLIDNIQLKFGLLDLGNVVKSTKVFG